MTPVAMATVSKKFSTAFDATKEEHVMWLRSLHVATKEEKSPNELMINNPFNIAISKSEILDWVDVMFSLSMKYAMAIMEGEEAFVPPRKAGSTPPV
jgi:hypothetical protein